ncbi:putative ribonuclease H-like domain-containing protein [Tanacetum coccineum]|uniref:Ribonuclease H-like domain-containing protein n=1 Tax=Tanacetum coccineum TaxID=301880 RepID=A0ABQ5CZK0_9ASTR
MNEILSNLDSSAHQVSQASNSPEKNMLKKCQHKVGEFIGLTDEKGIETKVPPKTAKALLQRQRERKDKSILLLVIIDEYQLRFHGIKDAKSLWAAIKSRFGGNVESKKMQKTVLKQQFENFSVSDIEGLDKAYDRFQKLISLLEVHGAAVPNEDVNQNFLRALSSSWNNVALIMRNQDGIDDLDIDDLYNNLKVFEADIKGFDKTKVECFNCHRRGHFAKGNDNDLIVQVGLGYDWSYIAQDEPTEFALMAYTSNSSGSDTEVQSCFKNCVKTYEKLQKQFDEQRQTLSKANLEIIAYQLGLESVEAHQISSKDKTGLGYEDQLNENDSSGSELFNSVFNSRSSDGDDNKINDRFKKDKGYHAVPLPLTGNYMPPLADLSFTGLDDSVYRPTTNKTSASMSQVETWISQSSNTSVEMPRVKYVRPSEVIFEDWVSDDDEDNFQSNDLQETDKPSFKKIKVNGVNTAGQIAVSAVKEMLGVSAVKAFAGSLDASQVLHRVPRQSNMYSFDLKNIVPSGDLTCLFAKATIDESKLWHRRLFYVNFKIMNKLVKGNLVRDPLGKFDGKAEEGFLVGYSVNSKAFRVFNSQTRKVEENIHVNFLENKPNVAGKGPNLLFDIDSLTNSMNYQPVTAGNQTNKNAGPQEANGNTGLKQSVDAGQSEEKNVSTQQYIVFPLWSSISSSYKSSDENDTTDSYAEKEATKQSDAVRKEFEAQCNRELFQGMATKASITNNFNTVSTPVNAASASRTSNDAVPSSVPLVQNTGIFGSAYDYEDLDTYNSPYADQVIGAEADFNNIEPSTIVSPIPSTRVHSIHPKDQIIRDPRSAIQTRAQVLDDESWIEAMQERRDASVQGFRRLVAQEYKQEEGIDYDKVFAPVARIEAIRISIKSLQGGESPYGLHQAPRAWYETLSTYLLDNGFYRGQIDKTLFIKRVKDFEQIMHKRSRMSSIGDITFFLGLQVKQKEDGIFISQDKYVGKILKKFGFSSIWIASTPMETNKALTKDEDGEDVDIHLYRCQFGQEVHNRRLSISLFKTKIHVDIESAICVVKNPVYHSKTKHIDIRHHFIRDSYEKNLIEMVKIHTDYNVADLFTKAFDVTRYRGLYTNELIEALFEEKLYGTMCINAVDYTTWILRMECKSCQVMKMD